MPNKSRRSTKKSKSHRRNAPRGQIVGLTNSPCILPPMFRGKMFYSTTGTMAVGTGALSTTAFRLNSVYDPDYTNVGTSVAGYTNMVALYNRYRVLNAKVHLTLSNLATTSQTAFAAVNSVNNVGTSFSQALAQRFVWNKVLAPTTGSSVVEHSLSVPIHKVYGVPAVQVRNEDDFAGVAGGNPNNVVYLHVGFYNYTGVATSALYTVRIEFDVVWSLPLEMS